MPRVKFPYGSDNDAEDIYSGLKIRELLNNKENPCDPVAFQALQLVNKLEAIDHILALEAKYGMVFIDRWSLSAIIYGAADGVDVVWSEKIAKWFDDRIKPTLMFVFTGKAFKKDNDIYGEKQVDVRNMYEEFCVKNEDNPNVIEIVVTDKTVEMVAFEVLCHIVTDMRKVPKPNISTVTTTRPIKCGDSTQPRVSTHSVVCEPLSRHESTYAKLKR
jgi:thymidylate kinase